MTAPKKPAKKKAVKKVEELFVTVSDVSRDDYMLSSGDCCFTDLADATSDAEDDINGSGYGCTPDEVTIYKLVPVRKLTRPVDVLVQDL